jgi:hypothetical protein
MLTDRQLYLGIALPGLISTALVLVVVWRRWAIAMPTVLGISVMAGYWLLRKPELPPQDGCDWLFWMQVPLMLGATVFQRMGVRGAPIGAMAGVVAFAVLRPIAPAIGPAAVWKSSLIAGAWGSAAAITLPWASRRIDASWIVGTLASVVGATAVVVSSSSFLAYGVIGLGAAVAIIPIALGLRWTGSGRCDDASAGVRGLSLMITALLAGLLAGGRYYPPTGVIPLHFHALGAAPLLIPLACCLPGKKDWVRGVAVVGLASAVAWCIAIPPALAAKHAAEIADSHVATNVR